MKKQNNPAKRNPASQRQPSRESHLPPAPQTHLLRGSSASHIYVVDLETARRLGDLDYHMCWPYSAE